MKETASNTQVKKFLSYVFVGSLATVVEWVCYWILRKFLQLPYILATVLAIIISTFSNWILGRFIIFRGMPQPQILTEILKIYAASSVGLFLNMFLMWGLHGCMGIGDILSKIFSTGIVFFYNYLVRVLVIYKK